MWPPRKPANKLMSRMSQLFSPGSKNKSSSNSKNKNDLSERDSLDRSPEGKLREKSSERVRPPLVEGRAVRDNDLLEYIPYNKSLDRSEKKTSNSNSNSSSNSNNKMGSPQMDESSPESAKAALLLLEGGGGSNNNSNNNNSSASSVSGQQQQQQQQQSNNNSADSGSVRSIQEEPEGSVDVSPSVTEGGSSNRSGSSSSNNPNLLVGTFSSFRELLEDRESVNLFKEYLASNGCEEYMKFWLICRGIKNFAEQDRTDMVEKSISKVMNHLVPKLECLRETEVLQDLHSRTDHTDATMFDRAQEVVVDYMDRTFYPNFLKSEVYIEKLQQWQQEAMMSNRQSQSGSVSSAASSISGRLLAAEAERTGPSSTGAVPRTRQMSNSGHSGSSIASSGTLTTLKSSTKSPNTSATTATTTLQPHQHHANQQMSSAASFSSTSLDPIDENKDLMMFTRSSNQSSSMRSLHHHKPQPLPLQPPQGNLPHQYDLASTGDLAPKSFMMSSKPSAPYHAKSSTFNPVSRNDSEIQSQSSGAVGGATTEDEGKIQKQQQQQQLKQQQQQQQQQQLRPVRRGRDDQRTRAKMEAIKNGRPPEDAVRPTRQQQELPKHAELAKEKPSQFAELLSMKLTKLLRDQQDEKERDRRFKAGMARAASSVDSFDQDTDQSILDDHCSRVFTDDTPQRTPPSRRRQHQYQQQQRRQNVSMNRTQDQQQQQSLYYQQQQQQPMSQSFTSGHQTWGHRPARQQQRYQSQFGIGQQQGSMAFNQSDLSYYPHDNARSLAARQGGASSARSFSDIAGNFAQLPQSNMQPYTCDRVQSWVKQTTGGIGGAPVAGGGRSISMTRAHNRTSPRSSGRHRSDHRSFSNETLQQQQQQQQQQQAMQTSFGGYPYNQMPPPPQQQNTVFIIYCFSETDKYKIKYSGTPDTITLAVIKEKSPKQGNFQFFFQIMEDGQTMKQLVTDDTEVVPMFNDRVIVEVMGNPDMGKTQVTANF